MKKFIPIAFMLTWFVFHTKDEDTVAKFLSQLPPVSAKEAKIVTMSQGQDFFVFYSADTAVKLK